MDTSDPTPTRLSTKRQWDNVDQDEVNDNAQKIRSIGNFIYEEVTLGDVVAPNPFTRPLSSSEYISVPPPDWEKKLYFFDLSVLASLNSWSTMVSALSYQEQNFRTKNGILEVGLPFNMYYDAVNKDLNKDTLNEDTLNEDTLNEDTLNEDTLNNPAPKCKSFEYTACVEFILQCIKDRNRNEALEKGDDLNHGVKAVTVDNYRNYVGEKTFDWSKDDIKYQKAFWSEEQYDIDWNEEENDIDWNALGQNLLRVYPTSPKYELTDQDLADFGRCNFRKLGILYYLTRYMHIPCLRIVTIAVLFDRIKKMSAEQLGNTEGNLWGHAV